MSSKNSPNKTPKSFIKISPSKKQKKKANYIPNMTLTNSEWTTLNKVIDSLLAGAEIDHIVVGALPKLEYVINSRLQDALSRNINEDVEKLTYHL